MIKLNKFLICLYFSFWGIVFFTKPVSAYIDPATSTYLLQIIAGIFIAGGTAVGVYWHKIKRLFKKDKNSSKKR